MKNAKAVVFFAILSIIGLLATFLFWSEILNADPYARYSFLMTILVAVVLGGYFWYLQKQDNDKIEELLKVQNKIAEEIHKQVIQQQQIQDSIRATSFKYIKANLNSARAQIDRMVHDIKNYKGRDEVERSFHLNDQLQRTAVFKTYPNAVEQQLTIARPYIHADLALKIESIAGGMRYLWLSSADHSDSRIFVAGIPDSVDGWFRYAQSIIANIDEVINEIQKAEDSLSAK